MKVAIEYHAPVSRPWQIIAGLLLCPLALAALAVAYAGAAIALSGGPLPPGAAVVYPGFAFVGIGGLVLSARLVLNRRRRGDQGLLSPFGLRIAGAAWAIAGGFLAYRSPAWIIELGAILGGALACFTLAVIRGRLDGSTADDRRDGDRGELGV